MKSVQSKFLAAFGLIAILLLIVASLSFLTSKKVTDQYDMILEDKMEPIAQLDHLLSNSLQIVANLRGYMLYREDVYLTNIDQLEQNSKATMDDLYDELGPNYEVWLDEMKDYLYQYFDMAIEVAMNYHTEGESDYLMGIASTATAMNRDFVKMAEDTIQQLHDEADAAILELENSVTQSNRMMVAIVIFAILGGLAIIVILSRSIRLPLLKATTSLIEMANGNLTIEPISVKTKDEIQQMATALNQMLATWNGVIRKVNDSSKELASQSEQLSASTEESLASSEMVTTAAENSMRMSEEQAHYVEQSTESLKEVGLGIDQITASNEEMLQSADEMEQYVQSGKQVMHDVSTQMNDIHNTIQQSTTIMEQMARKSSEIQEASALIARISEQTNLLALNAAIEAARAGEHGAGFAVVAEEVRNLAEESTKSASKIDEMIIEVRTAAEQAVQSILLGQQKVTTGLERTEESLSTFEHIERSVSEVHYKIETVSAAVEQIQAMSNEVLSTTSTLRDLAEQSTSTSQDTTAATEEQLAAMQEISASSERLAQLADVLKAEIAQFKIK